MQPAVEQFDSPLRFSALRPSVHAELLLVVIRPPRLDAPVLVFNSIRSQRLGPEHYPLQRAPVIVAPVDQMPWRVADHERPRHALRILFRTAPDATRMARKIHKDVACAFDQSFDELSSKEI